MLHTIVLLALLGSDAELLQNPGFNEDGDNDGRPDFWSISPQAAEWRERAYLSGDYEIASRPGAYVLATQRLELKPGQQYTLVLTLKGEGGGLGGALLLWGQDRPRREMSLIWNIAPSAEYEPYMTSFVAPGPVASLYLYNVARTGTICYDQVSLREGPPDRPFISQLTFKPIDQPQGEPLAPPGICWGRPLARGPLKTFCTIRTLGCSGDAGELARRLDLDADVVHTGYDGDQSVSETGRRATRRLEAGDYEVYVVPSRVSELLAATIRKRVEAGAGLVVIEGFGQSSKFADRKAWQDAPADHYLRDGVPWEMMPEKILDGVQTASLGRGRAVRLKFPADRSRVWGLLPSENSMDAYKARQFEYWEWWWSFLGRAMLWSAGREGPCRLHAVESSGSVLRLAAQSAPPGARARVVLRSAREVRFDGPLLRRASQEVPLGAGGALAVVLPPDLPAGKIIADVTLLDARGGALWWGSFAAGAAQQVRIAHIGVDRDVYGAGDQAAASVMLSAPKAVRVTAQARLVDAFGRVVSQVEKTEQLAAGDRSMTFVFETGRPLCVLHRAVVRVLVDGREQDSAWADVLVPEVGQARAAADFTATTWAPGMTHPVRLAQFWERIRALGFNAEFASNVYAISEHGVPCGGYMGPPGGVFRTEKPSPGGVRPKCLNNPAVVDDYSAKVRETASLQRPYGMFAVGITDEAFLTSRHQRDEVCFSPHCQARYRQWLARQYGSLAALNAEWGTSYGSWDEIRGARTEEIRGRENFAPFVDFRTFMTDVWVDACRTATAAYHQGAPGVPVGHTNTFGAEPFGGNDFWKLATETGFGWGQEYSEAIKADGQKAIFELWRSFVETPKARRSRSADGTAERAAPFFNYGWIGYQHSAAAAHYEPWWLALHGARGLSWYAVSSMDPARGVSWALVYPDLRLTDYSTAAAEGLRDLRAGCGKLLMEYERQPAEIALLWSYPSMLVAWCESKWDSPEPNERPGCDSYGTWFRSALNFRRHVDELQLGYDYLAPEQILSGDALARYRLLMLPFTVAMSPALTDRLENYVAGGGVVLADLRALRTDEHGKPWAAPGPLEQLFGVRRLPGDVHYGTTTVKFTAAGAGIDLGGGEVSVNGREGLTPTTARALAVHDDKTPAVLVRPIGKGLAVYLNFCLPAYDPVTRELVARLAARAGVRRPVVVESLAGSEPPRCYERNTFARGPITLHGFIRDHRRCQDSHPVRIAFGATSHVYDVRAGQHLGRTDAVKTVLPPGETALYACLPYRVVSLDVSAPAQVAPGAVLPVKLALRADPAMPGDHVVHVELLGPDGQSVWHYEQNALARAGRAEVRIPLALNDARGQWKVVARDVISGEKSSTEFRVQP